MKNFSADCFCSMEWWPLFGGSCFWTEFIATYIIYKYTYVSNESIESTRDEILPQYSDYIHFRNLGLLSLERKIQDGYFGPYYYLFSETKKKKLVNLLEKFANQWLFIGSTLGEQRSYVTSGIKKHPILKRARGEFLPMSKEDKR